MIGDPCPIVGTIRECLLRPGGDSPGRAWPPRASLGGRFSLRFRSRHPGSQEAVEFRAAYPIAGPTTDEHAAEFATTQPPTDALDGDPQFHRDVFDRQPRMVRHTTPPEGPRIVTGSVARRGVLEDVITCYRVK